MADYLGVWRSTYIRNENGETPVNFINMLSVAQHLGLSLDWFILNKGPKYYKEKEVKNQPPPDPLDSLPPDFKELIEHMTRIPMLRHEMLLSFCKFKEDRKDLVDAAMKKDKNMENS